MTKRKPGGSRSKVPLHSPNVTAIVKTLQQNPGLTRKALVPIFGWSIQHTGKVLFAAHEAGRVGYTRFGGLTRWWVIADLENARERLLYESKRAEKLADNRRNFAKMVRKYGQQADADGSEELSDTPMRRQVSASAPLPFVCKAPASVFHFGAML